MPAAEDLIWITDAVKEYGRSREWLDKQVDDSRLSVAKIDGDRRVYLLRSELDKLLRPQIVKPAKDSQAG